MVGYTTQYHAARSSQNSKRYLSSYLDFELNIITRCDITSIVISNFTIRFEWEKIIHTMFISNRNFSFLLPL